MIKFLKRCYSKKLNELKIQEIFQEIKKGIPNKEEDLNKIEMLLKENWYENVSDLKKLTEEDSVHLKIPYRLYQIIMDKIKEKEYKIDINKKVLKLEKKEAFSKVKIKNQPKGDSYSLKNPSLELKKEIEKFYDFMLNDFSEEKVRKVTADSYVEKILLVLGWIEKYQKIENLSLSLIFQNNFIKEYFEWLQKERKSSPGYEVNITKSLLKLSKFIYQNDQEILIIKELRNLVRNAIKRRKITPKNEEKKWIDFDEYLACVDYLKNECLKDEKKDLKELAMKYQKYLVCALLACIPDRQRTFRELELNRTLFKNENQWFIKHSADDYKTGNSYGDRPPLIIHKDIYPLLEDYLFIYRKELNPNHNYFFSTVKGEAPIHRNFIYNLFTRSIYYLTGKKINPHLVRDMIVTYFRENNYSESQLEALAIYMGHSIEIQRNVYDKRSKQQKIQPAIDLINSLHK